MTTLIELTPGADADLRARAWKRDRTFFFTMSTLAAMTVFAGFAPTYFLRSFSDRPALSPLLHVHGLIFTSWIVLFLVQVTLVASRHVNLHRRLGVAGGVIAILMVIVGFLAAVASAKRGFTPPGGPPPLTFLMIPLGDLAVFSGLVGCALYFRRKPEIHRRLMLLTTLALLTPAIARLPFMPPNVLAFLGVTDLFILTCLIYDRVTRGRIHPAFLWGAVAIIVSQPLRIVIGGTAAWLSVAAWLTHF